MTDIFITTTNSENINQIQRNQYPEEYDFIQSFVSNYNTIDTQVQFNIYIDIDIDKHKANGKRD